MSSYDAIMAESIRLRGHNNDEIEGYLARPLGPGPHGSVVVIHHLPGYDAITKEIVRSFAVNGYAAVCPNLYWRESPGVDPAVAAATARTAGGVPDSRLVGDVEGAGAYLRSLPTSNRKVGVIGYCSGGRQALLAACALPLDAAIDCYGLFVTRTPPEGHPLHGHVKPIVELTAHLQCPLLGLFGQDDKNPSPEEIDELEAALKANDKSYEFHRYEGTGHAFFDVDRPVYRPEAAMDGWARIWDFFGRYLTA